MNAQDEMREYVGGLFRRADSTPDESPERTPDPRRGNVAPKEGGSADERQPGDDSMREFTRRLFGRDPFGVSGA